MAVILGVCGCCGPDRSDKWGLVDLRGSSATGDGAQGEIFCAKVSVLHPVHEAGNFVLHLVHQVALFFSLIPVVVFMMEWLSNHAFVVEFFFCQPAQEKVWQRLREQMLPNLATLKGRYDFVTKELFPANQSPCRYPGMCRLYNDSISITDLKQHIKESDWWKELNEKTGLEKFELDLEPLDADQNNSLDFHELLALLRCAGV